MLLKLFLLFALLPMADLFLLVGIGQHLGLLPTLALVIFTAMAGAWLARAQGAATLLRIRASLEQGAMPGDELIDGLLILIAGVVLLTPGFITDLLGLLLLLPSVRREARFLVVRKLQERIKRGDVRFTMHRM